MKISEDMQRVIKQRSQRKSLYASVYKHLTIESCEIQENSAKMVIKLPVIQSWGDLNGNLSILALSHIIDSIPGIFIMALSPNPAIAIHLDITFTGQAKIGDILTLEPEFNKINSDFASFLMDVKSNQVLIAKVSFVSKLIHNLFWAKEKI